MRTTTRKLLPLPDATDPSTSSWSTGRGTTTTGVVRDASNSISTIADFFTDYDKDEVITGRWEFQAGILADKGSVVLLQNNTGAVRASGDVVMLDPANDSAFILPNAAPVDASKVYVVAEAIAISAIGRCTVLGIIRVSAVAGTTRGMYLQTQNASSVAANSAVVTPGSFAFTLTGLDGANTVLAAVHAGGAGGGLEVAEVDTAPDVIGARKLIFPNGSLTDQGGQVVAITFGSSILRREQFTVTGTTQVLTYVPDTVLLVSKNGVGMTSGTDYTLAAQTLTFTTAMAADKVNVIYMTTNSFNPSSAPYVQEFDPAAAATTVNLANVPTTIMMVVRNGVPQSQAKGDWTWNAGTSVITFSDAFVAGDHVIVAFAQNFGGGNAASVNNLPAVPASAPAANSLVATDATDKLPVVIIPTITPQMHAVEAVANQLTNGGVENWQRGNGPFTTTGTYTSDRWLLGIAGTDTVSISKNTATVDTGSLGSAACTVTVGTGAGATGFSAFLKTVDGNQIQGRTISFSCRIRTSTANAVRLAINTDGTGGTTTYSGYHSGGGTFETLSVTIAVPADATSVRVYSATFWVSCTAYIDNAMLVIGSVYADYQPLTPADDMARCQRYYEITGETQNELNISAYMTAGNYIEFYSSYKARKDVVPTITKLGTWTVVNCSQPSIAAPGVSGFTFQAAATALGQVIFNNNSSGAFFTSEANP